MRVVRGEWEERDECEHNIHTCECISPSGKMFQSFMMLIRLSISLLIL